MEEELDWWEDPKNKETFDFPISIIKDGDCWVVSGNKQTRNLLGERLQACAQGETKEDAINSMFMMINSMNEYSEECRLSYIRFVPFIKGNWKQKGGKWITIFGMNIYFRYGKKNKHGWFVPFTNLNISVSNGWKNYKNYMDKNK